MFGSQNCSNVCQFHTITVFHALMSEEGVGNCLTGQVVWKKGHVIAALTVRMVRIWDGNIVKIHIAR